MHMKGTHSNRRTGYLAQAPKAYEFRKEGQEATGARRLRKTSWKRWDLSWALKGGLTKGKRRHFG